MSLLRRFRGQASGEGGVPAGQYDPDSGLGKATWEFLTQTVWEEDGSPRQTGTVMLFADAGRLKAMLNDRDGSVVAFLTLSSEDDVLGAVDQALLDPDTDWRAARKQAPGKR